MAHAFKVISFDSFVEYGKEHAESLVNGMPWSFVYEGHPVTHETDDCYLISNNKFCKGMVLVLSPKGTLTFFRD